MTIADIKKILTAGESITVEFKESKTELHCIFCIVSNLALK